MGEQSIARRCSGLQCLVPGWVVLDSFGCDGTLGCGRTSVIGHPCCHASLQAQLVIIKHFQGIFIYLCDSIYPLLETGFLELQGNLDAALTDLAELFGNLLRGFNIAANQR